MLPGGSAKVAVQGSLLRREVLKWILPLQVLQDNINIVVQSVVEEDYNIYCYPINDYYNETIYSPTFTATYSQKFDFTGKFCCLNAVNFPSHIDTW